MRKIPYFILFLLVFGFVFSQVVPVSAQFDVSQVGNVFALEVYPSQPGPYQEIEVDASGSGINLDTIKMTWVVNGKVVASGTGIKSIKAISGATGSKMTISATAKTPLGEVSKTISLQIASVHLVWEGVTYIPSFYKGLPLPSNQSAVKIVAFPDIAKGGVKVPAENLLYTWKVNGTVMGDYSGYGKSSFTYKYPIIGRPAVIEALVSTPDQVIGARASVSITPTDPKILIYQENPVLGLMTESALDQTFYLTGPEVRFVAVPYFFSAQSRRDGSLGYKWAVGGNSVLSSANDPSAIVLRPQKGASGSTGISVSINSTDQILQGGTNLFTIIFGTPKVSN